MANNRIIEDLIANTIPAEGLEGLKIALNQLVANEKKNQGAEGEDYYIKYTFKDMQSLIKVDLKEPILVWYCDVFRRPAPPNVKETIQNFLHDHGSAKEQFQDLYFLRERQFRLSASISGETHPLPPDPVANAYELLAQETREKLAVQVNPQVSRLGIFAKGDKGSALPKEEPTHLPKGPSLKS